MKDVWDKTDEVICIHPSATRIYSYDLIIASWQQIFSSQEGLTILVNEPVYTIKQDVAIHYVKEELYIGESNVASILATNIYHQTQDGWKMIAHHASSTYSESKAKLNPSLH